MTRTEMLKDVAKRARIIEADVNADNVDKLTLRHVLLLAERIQWLYTGERKDG